MKVMNTLWWRKVSVILCSTFPESTHGRLTTGRIFLVPFLDFIGVLSRSSEVEDTVTVLISDIVLRSLDSVLLEKKWVSLNRETVSSISGLVESSCCPVEHFEA